MGRIKITESELRQLISESVVSVLNEGLFDGQAKRFKDRYNAYQAAAKDYDTNYANDFADLSQDQIAKYTDAYNKYKNDLGPDGADKYGNLEAYYNDQKNTAKKNMDAMLKRRGVGVEINKNIQTIYKQLGVKDQSSAINAVKNLQNANANYKDAIDKIYQALTSEQQPQQNLEEEYAVPPFKTQFYGQQQPEPGWSIKAQNAGATKAQDAPAQSPVPNLDQILKSIGDMKTNVEGLTKEKETLTATINTLKKRIGTLTAQNNSMAQRIQNTQNQLSADKMRQAQPTPQVNVPAPNLSKPAPININRRPAAPGTAQA